MEHWLATLPGVPRVLSPNLLTQRCLAAILGNQLTDIAPSRTLCMEEYFSDIYNFHCKSLGSRHFFKVAGVKYQEGLVVVKVFAVQDPTLPLTSSNKSLRN